MRHMRVRAGTALDGLANQCNHLLAIWRADQSSSCCLSKRLGIF